VNFPTSCLFVANPLASAPCALLPLSFSSCCRTSSSCPSTSTAPPPQPSPVVLFPVRQKTHSSCFFSRPLLIRVSTRTSFARFRPLFSRESIVSPRRWRSSRISCVRLAGFPVEGVGFADLAFVTSPSLAEFARRLANFARSRFPHDESSSQLIHR